MRGLSLLGSVLTLLLASGSRAEASTQAAHYIVFRLGAGGMVEPVYATEVMLDGPLEGLRRERSPAAKRRDVDDVGVTLIEANGRILFTDVVEVPRVVRGEFHGKGGVGIDGHFYLSRDRSFVVRLPASLHATLYLTTPGARRASRFDVDALLADSQARNARSSAAPQTVALEGWSNGNPANRVDLLVLGDGYTAAEAADFAADALAVVDGMFGVTPYREYRRAVNATAVFTPSLESGADQPPYMSSCTDYGLNQSCCADSAAAGRTGRFVSTAFDASYCGLNIQRLLSVNATKVFTVAAAVPDWDQILVIVNSSEYGGSGGGLSVISMHPAAVQLAQHEYGHSFAALADEYSAPYPGYPACSDVDPGSATCERNVTDETHPDLIKWSKWIHPAQPVPSSSPPPVATDAGAWLGARYLNSGMYRQGYQCMMRSLGAPLCDVASEAYVIRLYEGGWGLPTGGVDVIEPGTESPPPGDLSVADPGTTFAATLLGPAEGPELDVRWLVDGVEVSTSSAASGATVSYELEAATGQHTVQLRVTDVSPVLHPTTRPLFARTRTWNVAVGTVATTTLLEATTTSTAAEPPTTVTTTTSSTTTVVSASTTSTMGASGTTSTTLSVGTTTSTVLATTTSSSLGDDPLCARPVSGGETPLATDCLFLLHAAVGLTACTPECVCAPKGALPVSATDALVCLNAAVGAAVELRCPCGPFP